MVNKNLKTITENKKPFEMVYELKNEIPSFEEFMKTYEANGRINDSYELEVDSYGDISKKNEGYGPCTSSYCTHSRSELQEQLRELERKLKELENSVNVYYYRSEITVIQQNITIILGKIDSLPTVGNIDKIRFYVGGQYDYFVFPTMRSSEGINFENARGVEVPFFVSADEWQASAVWVKDINGLKKVKRWIEKGMGLSDDRALSLKIPEGGMVIMETGSWSIRYNSSHTRRMYNMVRKIEGIIERYERGENLNEVFTV